MTFLIKLCKKLKNYFENNSKNVCLAWGYIFLILIGCIDYQIPPEISLSIFYLLPVSLISWFVGKEAGFLASVLSAIAWFISNPLGQQTGSSILVDCWNAIVRLIFFLIVSRLLVELHRALTQEKESARTDSITGVGNKQLFFELAHLEIKKADRYRHPLTIIYIDIDDFKKINQDWGTNIGNKLLIIVAKTLKGSLRETDIIARIGVDEFVILLPGSGYEPAQTVLDRVQKRLVDAMHENEWLATFSIGAVTFINPPNSVDEMIQRADHLIYLVKNTGKNQLKHKTSV